MSALPIPQDPWGLLPPVAERPRASLAPGHELALDPDGAIYKAERERRMPMAREVARAIFDLWQNGRTDARYHQVATFDYAPKDTPDAAWRPCYRSYDVGLVEAMVLGDQVGTRLTQRGLGLYAMNEANETSWVAIDIDAHKDGESAEVPCYALQRALSLRGIPHLLARSKGGKGFHFWVFFDQLIPGRVARALARWLLKEAGLPASTEVFPKQDQLATPTEGDASKVAGSQIALPGCLNFWVAKSGSVLLDSHRNVIPFERWADVLRAHARLSVDALRQVSDSERLGLFSEAPARSLDESKITVIRGQQRIESAQALEVFLARHGLEVMASKGAHGKWSHRMLLRRCANAEAHGSSRTDGAAVLFDQASGRVGYKCWHAACQGYSWGRLLRGLGYQTQQLTDPTWYPSEDQLIEHTSRALALLATPEPDEDEPQGWVDPRDDPDEQDDEVVLRHDPREKFLSLTDAQRDALRTIASDHFKDGSDERRRLGRVAACGRWKVRKTCDRHGEVHNVTASCGYIRACPHCASHQFVARRQQIVREWPDKVGVMIYQVSEERAIADPGGTHADLRAHVARWRRWARRHRVPMRRWITGIRTAVFFFGREDDVEYLGDEMRWPSCYEVKNISHRDAADLAYDVLMEPALFLASLLEKGLAGTQAAIEYPFLVDDESYRCTDANKNGDKLPWFSDEELRLAAAEERARLAEERGEPAPEADPRSCPVLIVQPDGSKRRCGCLLRPSIWDGDRCVHKAKYGAPGWLAVEDAVAADALDREHRRWD